MTVRRATAQAGHARAQRASERGARAVGIFGGTFNPIHLGHLRAAEEVADRLGIEEVRFVPASDPPLKSDDVAPAKQRLEWVELALSDNPRFQADGLELRRSGPSYTADTLRELGEEIPREHLVFFLGCDAFRELPSWREPGVLLTLSNFAVMTRQSSESSLLGGLPAVLREPLVLSEDGEAAHHRDAGTWIRRVPIEALPISATDVRQRLRENRSVRYLVPETLREVLVASEAYV